MNVKKRTSKVPRSVNRDGDIVDLFEDQESPAQKNRNSRKIRSIFRTFLFVELLCVFLPLVFVGHKAANRLLDQVTFPSLDLPSFGRPTLGETADDVDFARRFNATMREVTPRLENMDARRRNEIDHMLMDIVLSPTVYAKESVLRELRVFLDRHAETEDAYDLDEVAATVASSVQTWVPNDEEGGLPIKESDVPGVLAEFSPKPVAYQFSCDRKGKTDKDSDFNCHPPSCDFAHFMGTMKPWQKKVTLPFMDEHNTYERNAPFRLWFEELARLNDEHDMKLDLQNWNEVHLEGMKTAPLGVMAKWVDQALMVKRKYGIPPRGDFTVAYAVSFIKCGDFQTNAAGLIDASLIIRHSIHKMSSRNPSQEDDTTIDWDRLCFPLWPPSYIPHASGTRPHIAFRHHGWVEGWKFVVARGMGDAGAGQEVPEVVLRL
eukprot:CAMPEP_0113331038 /NCGR_PEP_ID=MMETSP0010_2-20120614/22203_1 /TAXON_ID=216773 ORGANISM="Corethron hystrix, Strain 308" /NCGR_SAMPLE_ID=MMETSP0010_2 /ASSEMBLY_ACC=CAM_ASM_000155 /LENGTH=432 /DNA_ID=CAMNT_0000194133 /DNA_START=159 /DNA_END=1459 /DNA_ORIENTATION=+ /assembly_acc=CAM_ASM_000155